MVTLEKIKLEYPLHWLVWQNEFENLSEELKKNQHDKEKKDARGRTPLMLAVTLGHLESVRILLNNEANVNVENSEGWTVLQEATATGDPELLQLVLERRNLQRHTMRMEGIPMLLERLKEAPDFYVEMKWEFTSWVPLLSRMCPSDTYKVYKKGSNVRIDTTLLGFDTTSWQRGNRSYIFQGRSDGATMLEIDHDLRQVYCEEMQIQEEAAEVLLGNQDAVSQRLTTPIATTYIDTEKISFERNKAGMWGWRSDKSEGVNGFFCKVFGATNVELVTKTRTEHLTESDKARCKSNKTPLQSFLGIAEIEENNTLTVPTNEIVVNSTNPCNITPEEYFDPEIDMKGRDIGRPKECNMKVQKFKATLWLSEEYPLSLPEQILPIVDLMSISSPHFAKLKDFIQLQLPAGFPVKIEIPIFHVLNARITFGNIFGLDSPIPKVTRLEDDQGLSCVLDETLFECPPDYIQLGNAGLDARRQFSMEEEDDLLQFAIQQSLIDAGTEKEEVDIWEALKAQKPSRPTTPNNFIGQEERQLQRAIQASLFLCQSPNSEPNDSEGNVSPETDDLQRALLLSRQEQMELEEQRLREEKLLEEILQLSLTEK
ncbi:ankyrin repeat domain-containing protein 13D isoform X1 [Coccinella septempunctata]|uniref:ankyrin repeat domain-containing protein 13D isoform X1 n=1 Tax=Coccinella septempunctata TaxID=41139 RepID=UPI001D07F548|nr:ankyrin repeat domain-containing protein 13D isoform X1 [Coccinella septempunctata]